MEDFSDVSLSRDDGSPLYLQVASLLEKEISAGRFPVGSLLPTEADLSAMLKVSRHTVRQAIGQMRARGRVSARKGVGTRVEQARDDMFGRFTTETRGDLFDFARETELRFSHREVIEARGQLAVQMGCRPGRKYYHAAGLRFIAGEDKPMCWNEVYLEPRLRSVIESIDVLRVALFMLIEKATGERIREIHQEIRAIPMPAHVARALGREEGDICMRLSRRYIASGGRMQEFAMQFYPAESFAYQTRIQST
ncbi:GntR family transcriptional regulator [Mesobacterium pallidum]|uniref:GntR family transcriptional regulator n=1 Tax=Mesobacterium pallidum TaxID=2872037 RepID=UPI001EE207AE|nr:GntR family transcriptional regulator [Mesobacterium pallidum]